jgi:hypothetical protein
MICVCSVTQWQKSVCVARSLGSTHWTLWYGCEVHLFFAKFYMQLAIFKCLIVDCTLPYQECFLIISYLAILSFRMTQKTLEANQFHTVFGEHSILEVLQLGNFCGALQQYPIHCHCKIRKWNAFHHFCGAKKWKAHLQQRQERLLIEECYAVSGGCLQW